MGSSAEAHLSSPRRVVMATSADVHFVPIQVMAIVVA